MSKIYVIAEARDGQVKKPSLEAVTAGLELAQASGGEVTALVAGANLDAAKAELQKSGAKAVVAVEGDVLANYSGDGYAKALHPLLADAAVVLMPHSAMGRDLMPRLAAMLDAGLVSDATALHFDDGKFGATKPVYAGKAYRKAFAQSAPFCATLRPNNWAPTSADGAEVSAQAPSFSADELRAVVQEVMAAAGDKVPLSEAKVVVAGGRGLQGPENFHIVEKLADAFGAGTAAVGASRAVVDAGWRPHSEQVGQTGKVVAPVLYIAVGISGAIQHLAGMRTSRFIVAINKDANAPIFKVADYGIVGDAFEIVPALTEAVAATAS